MSTESNTLVPKEVSAMQISLRVNSYVFLFGLPLLLTLIILGTVGVSYMVTKPNVMMPNVTVQSPKVEANLTLPTQLVPAVKAPDVVINVPPSNPNIVVNSAPSEPPKVSIIMPEGRSGEVQVVEKIVEKTKTISVPVYVATAEGAVITIKDVYAAAEKYISDYCRFSGKDPQVESKRWLSVWEARIKEVGDEQRLANESLVQKRGGFDVAEAKSDEVVEVCRLMLRYRDAKLAFPAVFKEVLTASNLCKFKAALEEGVKLPKPADISARQ